MITSTTLGPPSLPGCQVHPEERPEAPSKAPPATPAPAAFRNSLRVRPLLIAFSPWLVQAEQVGDTGGEQGQAEDVVGASHAGVSEEDDRNHQHAGQLEDHNHLPRRPSGRTSPDDDEGGVDHHQGQYQAVRQVAYPYHAPLPVFVVDLWPWNSRGSHVEDVPAKDADVTEAVPFDAPQAQLVEETLVPYQDSLEVIGAPPSQLRRNRVAEAEGDVLGRIEGPNVVDVTVSHPEVQARVLAEAGGFTGRRAVVQYRAGQNDRGACHDAGEGQGLAAETEQQRHRQHREVQNELRAVGDRYAPEQARHQTEPSCPAARGQGRRVAGPQGSEQKRQRGRLGREESAIRDVQWPERAEHGRQGGCGRSEKQARQPPREKRDRGGERAPQHGPGP